MSLSASLLFTQDQRLRPSAAVAIVAYYLAVGCAYFAAPGGMWNKVLLLALVCIPGAAIVAACWNRIRRKGQF